MSQDKEYVNPLDAGTQIVKRVSNVLWMKLDWENIGLLDAMTLIVRELVSHALEIRKDEEGASRHANH